MKSTEVEARVALVCASTDDGRPLTASTDLIWTVVDWVTNPAVCHDKVVNQQIAACSVDGRCKVYPR